MASNNDGVRKSRDVTYANLLQLSARDTTELSTFGQRLVGFSALSLEAIDSDSQRRRLLTAWKALEKDAASEYLDDRERQLLFEVSHNSDVLARMMSSVESLLDNIVVEAEAIVTAEARSVRKPSSSSEDRMTSEPTSKSISFGDIPPCLMRTWFYENLIYPFPSVSIRRQIQACNRMSMSNINGWFSNMRRRSGWNEFCRRHAYGDRSATSHLLRACFEGEVENEVLVKEIVAMIDYVMGGRVKGDVGSWLTKIVGCEKPDLRTYTDIKLDVTPKNTAKRNRDTGRKDLGLARQKEIDDLSDDEASDAESEAIMEIDPYDRPIAPVMASTLSFHPGYLPNNQSHTVLPYRTLSGSSTTSSVSNISAGIHSRVPSSEYSRRPDDASSIFTSSPAYTHHNPLPIAFGGPPQYYGFQPHLPPLDQPRGMKRPMHQMDEMLMDPRAVKFSRFG